MLSVLKKQLWSMKGYRGDFTDDVLGFDPNGGGIHDLTRDLQGVFEPWLVPIRDDWLGFDEGGGGLTSVANVVGPAVLAYFTGGALGGALGGAAEGAVAADSAFVAADAAQLAAQGLSAAQVEATLVASGVSSTAASSAAAAAAAGAGEAEIAASIAKTGGSIFTDPTSQQIFTSNPDLIQSVGDTYGVDPSQVNSAVTNAKQGLWGSEMNIGDIGNYLGDQVQAGNMTMDEAMQAMQAYNDAASGGTWGEFLSSGAADDWMSSSGLSLNDVYNYAKQGKSVSDLAGSILGSTKGAIGNTLSRLTGQDIANLGAGGLSWLLANQYAGKQEDLANRMLTEADPYYQYRKDIEQPARANYAGMAPAMIGGAGQTGQKAYDTLSDMFYQDKLKQSYTDPLSVYNSPEMQALNAKFMDQISRRDAAAGRNSQYGARAIEAQNNFLANSLPQYRTGLTQGQQAATQQGQGLSSLFGQQGNLGTAVAGLGMAPSAGAGAGATSFGNLMTEANKAGTYASNPFLQSMGLNTGGVQTGQPSNSGVNLSGLSSGLSSLYNNISNSFKYQGVQDAMNSGAASYEDLQNIANNAYDQAAASGWSGFGGIPTDSTASWWDASSLWS